MLNVDMKAEKFTSIEIIKDEREFRKIMYSILKILTNPINNSRSPDLDN